MVNETPGYEQWQENQKRCDEFNAKYPGYWKNVLLAEHRRILIGKREELSTWRRKEGVYEWER